MDWSAAIEKNRETLKRIAALLLALADLAERAGARPRPVLCLVLWILRPAEAVAREFVIGAAHDLGAPARLSSLEMPMRAAPDGARAAEALRLAVDFRMLAAALDDLAARPLGRWRTLRHTGLLLSALKAFASEAPASPPEPLRRAGHLFGARPAYADTS